jgi:predicted SprT family Zn-dependent metalloprotease
MGNALTIQCPCGQLNRLPEEPQANCFYRCSRCKGDLYSPNDEAHNYRYCGHPRQFHWPVLKRIAVILLIVGFGFYDAWHDSVQKRETNLEPSGVSVQSIQTPAEARESQIVGQDGGKPGDSELDKDYMEVNEKFFGNNLPKIPVLWEPKLDEVGPLKGKGFIEEGLASANPELILLNTVNRGKRDELRRVLCHEMVHIYLFTKGDTKTHHGPAFQTELHNLLLAGAFQGVWATEEERSSLKTWLKNESHRLHAEAVELKRGNTELDEASEELGQQKTLLEQEYLEMNQRITLANQQGNSWPTDGEIEAFKDKGRIFDRQTANFNAEVTAFNKSIANHDARLKTFNYAVRRYNLMMAYPDGLDGDSIIQTEEEQVLQRLSASTPAEVAAQAAQSALRLSR